MKQHKKCAVVLIIATVVVAAVILLLVFIAYPPYLMETSYDAPLSITEIRIKCANVDVVLTSIENSVIRVLTEVHTFDEAIFDSIEMSVDISADKNILTISETDALSASRSGTFRGLTSIKITVGLPISYIYNTEAIRDIGVQVNIESGRLTFTVDKNSNFPLGVLVLKTNDGSMSLSNVYTRQLVAQARNGNIHFTDLTLTAKSIALLQNTNGDVIGDGLFVYPGGVITLQANMGLSSLRLSSALTCLHFDMVCEKGEPLLQEYTASASATGLTRENEHSLSGYIPQDTCNETHLQLSGKKTELLLVQQAIWP